MSGGLPHFGGTSLRNSALITLAADLPPSVLSSLLGISLTSALKWTRRAGCDWNSYLASRADDQTTTRRSVPARVTPQRRAP